MAAPDMELLEEAKEKVVEQYMTPGHAHTVYIGETEKDGEPTGQIGIVVKVEEKLPTAQLISEGIKPIPSKVEVDGACVPVDVQVAPQPVDQRAWLTYTSSRDMQYVSYRESVAQAGENWQSCHNVPLMGGVQIAPDKAGWVGTLSGACKFISGVTGKLIVGAFSNYHVAVGSETVGLKQGQPSGSAGDWFARLDRWSPMSGNQNRVDAAMLNTWRDDGKYAPGCHTVKPEQYRIGAINPDPVHTYKIGDEVQKSGRTTGHTIGKVVGVGAVSSVQYGGSIGVLRFVDQIIIRAASGQFSDSGDSGSLVLTMDRRPYGLLFAGGGRDTIINQIKDVQAMFGMEFFGP